MTEFEPGDKIRVTYEAVYDGLTEYGNYRLTRPDHDLPEYMYELSSATVELIERADDPATDPIGTVRGGTGTIPGTFGFVKVRKDDWRLMGSGDDESSRWYNHEVENHSIIGAAPGTPGDQEPLAQWERDLLHLELEPRTWNDPKLVPADVKVIEDSEGDELRRHPVETNKWAYVVIAGRPISSPLYVIWGSSVLGPYTEVK